MYYFFPTEIHTDISFSFSLPILFKLNEKNLYRLVEKDHFVLKVVILFFIFFIHKYDFSNIHIFLLFRFTNGVCNSNLRSIQIVRQNVIIGAQKLRTGRHV